MAKEVKFRIAVENAAKSTIAAVSNSFKRLGKTAAKAGKRGKLGMDDFIFGMTELTKVMGPIGIIAGGIGGVFKTAFSIAAKTAKIATGAIVGLGAAMLATIKVSANRSDLESGLGKLVGDAKEGTKLFNSLVKFSDATPFEVEPLIGATQKLLTFGFTADEVLPKLKLLGDASSAMKKPLDEVALAYGRLAAAARDGAKTVDADVLNSLRDQGLLTLELRNEILKLLKAGKGLEALKLFEDKSLKKFSGSMAELSLKFNGLVSTIKGKASSAMAAFGKVFLPQAEQAAAKLAKAIADLTESGAITDFANKVKGRLGAAFVFAKGKLKDFVDGGGLERLQKRITAIASEAKKVFSDLFGGDDAARTERLASIQSGVFDAFDKAVNAAIDLMVKRAPDVGAAIVDGFKTALSTGVKTAGESIKGEAAIIGRGVTGKDVDNKAFIGAVEKIGLLAGPRGPNDLLQILPRVAKSVAGALIDSAAGATGKRDPAAEGLAINKKIAKNTGDSVKETQNLGM